MVTFKVLLSLSVWNFFWDLFLLHFLFLHFIRYWRKERVQFLMLRLSFYNARDVLDCKIRQSKNCSYFSFNMELRKGYLKKHHEIVFEFKVSATHTPRQFQNHVTLHLWANIRWRCRYIGGWCAPRKMRKWLLLKYVLRIEYRYKTPWNIDFHFIYGSI